MLIIIPFLVFSQNSNNQVNFVQQNTLGCQDLDETLIEIVSIFGDTSLLDGLLGCVEIIPTLESGILSAFLPFEIPLDCNTDLTPFGYLDVNLSDICQCSCENYLNLILQDFTQPKLIKTIDFFGRQGLQTGFYIDLYDNGTIIKNYQLIQ